MEPEELPEKEHDLSDEVPPEFDSTKPEAPISKAPEAVEQLPGSESSEPTQEADSLEGGRWTAPDGSRTGKIYEDALVEALDAPEADVSVDKQVGVSLPGEEGRVGYIDVLIGNKIIEIKTHDMLDWTQAHATRMAEEHAEQVRGYMDSPDTADNAEGYLLMAGREPQDRLARDAYVETAREREVEAQFPVAGNPEAIVEHVRDNILSAPDPQTSAIEPTDYGATFEAPVDSGLPDTLIDEVVEDIPIESAPEDFSFDTPSDTALPEPVFEDTSIEPVGDSVTFESPPDSSMDTSIDIGSKDTGMDTGSDV